MKRVDFVKSFGLVVMKPPLSLFSEENPGRMIVPDFLKPGSVIGITSPAGYISLNDIEPCRILLEQWGFRVKIGSSVGKQWNTFGGSDEERYLDFQEMLNNKQVDAIMCARGGYGMVRIIDRINFSAFWKNPKWILGFSDITVLHAHLNKVVQVASMHCKMCNSFPTDMKNAEPEQIAAIESIRKSLMEKDSYSFPATFSNRVGIAKGELVGGNLKTLETLSGTISDVNTSGKILFVEETGEYLYSIDRMFWNLLRTGKLNKLAGLLIGGMKIRPDDPGEEFGMTLEDIVMEKVRKFNYPVAFGLPVGHQKNNVAVKCGVNYRLSVTENNSVLEEI